MLVWFKLLQSEIFFSPQANFTKRWDPVPIFYQRFLFSLLLRPASFLANRVFVQFPRGGFCAGCIACLTGFCAEGYFGVLGIPRDFVWIIIQSHNHLNQFDFVLATDESQSCLQEIFLLKDNCSDQRGRAVNIIMIEILTTERTWYILSGKSYKCFLKV